MPTIDEAIERAAKALCESGLGAGAWDAINNVQQQQFIRNAKAALSAFLADVPVSEAVWQAGIDCLLEHTDDEIDVSEIHKVMSAKQAEEIQ